VNLWVHNPALRDPRYIFETAYTPAAPPQMAERLVRNEKVRGSTARGSTTPQAFAMLGKVGDQGVNRVLRSTPPLGKSHAIPGNAGTGIQIVAQCLGGPSPCLIHSSG